MLTLCLADDTVCLPDIKNLCSNRYLASGRCRGNHRLHGGKFNQTSWNSQFWEVTYLILLLAYIHTGFTSACAIVLNMIDCQRSKWSILLPNFNNTVNRLYIFPTGELDFVKSSLFRICYCSQLLVTSKRIFKNFKYNREQGRIYGMGTCPGQQITKTK